MKKTALIGASGFVGSAILNELLSRGYQVEALVRNPDNVKVENPLLTVKKVDVADTEALAAALKGYDTVISAYNPGWANPDIYNLTLQNYPRILQAAKEAGVKRLLIVGGAGTLFCAPGLRVVDSGVIPAELRPKIPASIFKTLSKALTSVPISVTL
jgi:NAD-dependent epimerase/dehydratase